MRLKVDNYFSTKMDRVNNLKHFPFPSFEKFQQAIKDKKVIDIGIPMDYARKWAMESVTAPKFQKIVKYVLMLVSIITPIFYWIMAFAIGNFWLLLYSLVPVVVFFTGSPIARKVFPLHQVLIIIFVLLWIFIGGFPSWIYWLPVTVQLFIMNYLYKSSTQLVRKIVQYDEGILSLFWKWWDLILVLDNGEEHSQRSLKQGGQYIYHEDVQKEWKEFIKNRKLKKEVI